MIDQGHGTYLCIDGKVGSPALGGDDFADAIFAGLFRDASNVFHRVTEFGFSWAICRCFRNSVRSRSDGRIATCRLALSLHSPHVQGWRASSAVGERRSDHVRADAVCPRRGRCNLLSRSRRCSTPSGGWSDHDCDENAGWRRLEKEEEWYRFGVDQKQAMIDPVVREM